MLRRILITLLIAVAGLAMFGIAGCYGPSPSMEPRFEIEITEDDAVVTQVYPGTKLTITGEVITDDSSQASLVESYFVVEPDLPGGGLIYSGINYKSNVYLVPPVTQSTEVVIVWKVKTLSGHKSELRRSLTILPAP